jgi:hypothetical protein
MDNDKLMSEIQVKQYDFDPNATTATAVAWVDMKGFTKFLVAFFRTVGTANATLSIQASAAAAGTNAETIVSKTFTAGQPNALAYHVFLECLSEQVAAIAASTGKDLRYVSAVISLATNTDEGVVTYILGGPRFAYDGLTADYVS